jgi:putative ABC transport system permease protein
MFRNALWRTGWRYLIRHPWQTVLMILGITLGVAVVVAVDLANASAMRAFDLSTEAVAGKATHQISGGPQGISDEVYVKLRYLGLNLPIAPVISEYASSLQLGGRTLQVIGVDPFAEPPFRNYLDQDQSSYAGDPSTVAGRAAIDLTAFLTRPGAVLISQSLADRYDLRQGQHITLQIAGRSRDALIAGVLLPRDDLTRRALDGLILADIATLQELTGRAGWLDRIDLILLEKAAEGTIGKQIRAALPPGMHLETVAARSGAVEQMTSAFHVNLTALSLLALLVGLFLIYNTMTFSVVQRRPFFGILRCLGVPGRRYLHLS